MSEGAPAGAGPPARKLRRVGASNHEQPAAGLPQELTHRFPMLPGQRRVHLSFNVIP
ncbi:hypothetical protein SVIOM342S_09068 [Streptomyces violaceorubidus]